MAGRITYIDLAKGVGILSVIVSHFTIASTHILRVSWPHFILHSFHVPLFFIIAGMLYKDQKVRRGEFLAKKVCRLLVPCLVTCLLLFLIRTVVVCCHRTGIDMVAIAHNFISVVYGDSWWRTNTLVGSIDPVGPVWFLWALFWALLVRRMIDSVWIGLNISIALMILARLWIKLGAPWLPFSLLQAAAACFYVYVGSVLSKYFHLNGESNHGYILMFLGGGGDVIAMLLNILFKSTVDMAQVTGHPIVYMTAIPISCAILAVVKRLSSSENVVLNLVRFVGENSLLILCIHTIMLFDFPWDWLWKKGGETWLVSCVFACLQLGMPIVVAALFQIVRLKRSKHTIAS